MADEIGRRFTDSAGEWEVVTAEGGARLVAPSAATLTARRKRADDGADLRARLATIEAIRQKAVSEPDKVTIAELATLIASRL